MTTLIDISPVVGPNTAVWPGDQAYSAKTVLSLEAGASVALSTITSTLHVGAHADAPSHYKVGAASIDKVDLNPYWGQCQVIEVKDKSVVSAQDLSELKPGVQRVLIKTSSMPDPNFFNEDFSYFSVDAIEKLAKSGVILVGIDTPSVDAFSSKDLPVHHALLKHQIRNLEGLVLAHIPAGLYELVALPLKLSAADASPVRAVLRTLS